MLERMTKELNLDEAQRAKAETILKAQEEKSQAVYKDLMPTPEEQQKLEGLRQARREARRAGNAEEEARVAEEMRKVQQARQARLTPMQERLAAIEKEEHDSLLAVMRDDQKEKFEKFWADWMTSRRPAGPVRSPQALKAMIDKLANLTAEQKKQIEEAFAGFKKTVREDVKEDSPEYRQRTRQLYEDVMKALTPEQREKILAQLREGRPDRGGRRGFRGGRGDIGAASQPARPVGEKPGGPS
jgi:Spy/CpxP family protein refolding chaperone